MSKVEYKIVFLDIDGTILTNKGDIPNKTKIAVALLKEKGIDVCIATGRPLENSLEVGKELGIDSYITFTGSHVIYKGKEIFKQSIPKSIVQKLLHELDEQNIPLLLNSSDGNFVTHEKHPYVREITEPLCFTPEAFKNKIQNLKIEDVAETYQMLLFCNKEKEVELAPVFTDLKVVRWHKYCADVVLPNASKALGIQKLLEYLELTPEQAIAFGDELNDVEMLSYVGMGIAMGNANKKLLPYSKAVTSHVDKSGIYKGLKKLGVI